MSSTNERFQISESRPVSPACTEEALAAMLALGTAELESELVRVATGLGRLAVRRQVMIATAESCTGGAIARALTETAGSSEWFDGGFVTYSNAAKCAMLGVDSALIESHGAVSEPVARAMVCGAILRSQAGCAVAVTGVAGPGGGTPDKPVGLVWFAWGIRRPDGSIDVLSHSQRLPGDRTGVRLRTSIYGLAVLAKQLAERHPIA